MSLCITLKHLSRLVPKKYMSDPIALQYSVKHGKYVELDKELQSQLTLFPHSIIVTALSVCFNSEQSTHLVDA